MFAIQRKENVATVVFLSSLICSGATILLVRNVGIRSNITFPFELQFFLILCAACSALLYWFERPVIIVPAHIIHLASLIIIVRMLGGLFAIPEIIIIVPFLLECAIYLELGPGLALNGLLWIAAITLDVSGLRHESLNAMYSHISLTTVTVVCIAAIGSALTHYREIIVRKNQRITALSQSVIHLSEANQAFQVYADHVESQSATDERNRITRELHDTVGYALTNVTMSMNAGMVLTKTDPSKLNALFTTTKQQAEAALQETRQTLYRLRAVRDIEPIGLNAILRLTSAFEAASNIEVSVHYGNAPNTFGPRIDEVIYRLVQEGLTNAFRHGRASAVKVSMWLEDQEIQITVWDNGLGNDAISEGIGLLGMSERVAELGGELDAFNAADGFKLTARIPYRKYRVDG